MQNDSPDPDDDDEDEDEDEDEEEEEEEFILASPYDYYCFFMSSTISGRSAQPDVFRYLYLNRSGNGQEALRTDIAASTSSSISQDSSLREQHDWQIQIRDDMALKIVAIRAKDTVSLLVHLVHFGSICSGLSGIASARVAAGKRQLLRCWWWGTASCRIVTNKK